MKYLRPVQGQHKSLKLGLPLHMATRLVVPRCNGATAVEQH